jgi:hypothetical protein
LVQISLPPFAKRLAVKLGPVAVDIESFSSFVGIVSTQIAQKARVENDNVQFAFALGLYETVTSPERRFISGKASEKRIIDDLEPFTTQSSRISFMKVRLF